MGLESLQTYVLTPLYKICIKSCVPKFMPCIQLKFRIGTCLHAVHLLYMAESEGSALDLISHVSAHVHVFHLVGLVLSHVLSQWYNNVMPASKQGHTNS